jgi:catechol 2,3-dioxygenase-like lactoylglutathione lyase family enzyme
MSARDRIPLIHIGLAVGELDVALRFYEQALGWAPLGRPVGIEPGAQVRDVLGPGTARFRQAHLETPAGPLIELFELRGAPGPGDRWRPGWFHVCIRDRELDARVRRIEACGGRRLSRNWEHRPGSGTSLCYCADPFGNIVEVASA